jgi:hypothetical protein
MASAESPIKLHLTCGTATRHYNAKENLYTDMYFSIPGTWLIIKIEMAPGLVPQSVKLNVNGNSLAVGTQVSGDSNMYEFGLKLPVFGGGQAFIIIDAIECPEDPYIKIYGEWLDHFYLGMDLSLDPQNPILLKDMRENPQPFRDWHYGPMFYAEIGLYKNKQNDQVVQQELVLSNGCVMPRYYNCGDVNDPEYSAHGEKLI